MSDEDFKYLVEEFGSKNVEILKQKGAYPYEYMNSFERFNEETLSARKYFFSSTKKGKIDNDGKISDGHVSIKDYMTCEKIWDIYYGLDPYNYFSSPGLSWDAMLKMTGKKIRKNIRH